MSKYKKDVLFARPKAIAEKKTDRNDTFWVIIPEPGEEKIGVGRTENIAWKSASLKLQNDEASKRRSEVTINELMSLIMNKKGISKKEVAEKLGKCETSVSQFVNRSANPWMVNIQDFFNAIDEPFDVVHKGFVFHVPSTITTLGQLRKKVRDVYFRFGNGKVYKVVENEPWNS